MTHLDLCLESRVRRSADVKVGRRDDAGTFVLRREGRYLAVSARCMDVWHALDGLVDLRSVAKMVSVSAGRDITTELMQVIGLFIEVGFVVLTPGPSAHGARTAERNDGRPSRTLLEGYVTFSPQCWVNRCYSSLEPRLRPPLFAVLLLVGIAGAAAYLWTGHFTSMRPCPAGYAFVGVAVALSVIAHEAAHALTLRHFGGDVPRAGVGWYWFMPTAFVDTSDAHLLARRQRIAVCLAGPASDAVLAGAAVLVAVASRGSEFAAWSSTWAGLLYMGIFWNLNPLLATDGYYALTDILNRPNLRRDGIAQLFGRGRCRDALGTLYGIAAVVYAGFYVAYAIPMFVIHTVGPWIAPSVSRSMQVMLAAAGVIGTGVSMTICIVGEQRAHRLGGRPAMLPTPRDAAASAPGF